MHLSTTWPTKRFLIALYMLWFGLVSIPEAGAQRLPQDSVWEKHFLGMPNADSLSTHMKKLSARPHHVGSPYDRENAEWIR